MSLFNSNAFTLRPTLSSRNVFSLECLSTWMWFLVVGAEGPSCSVSLCLFLYFLLFPPWLRFVSVLCFYFVFFCCCCTFCVISLLVTLEMQQASLIYDILAYMSSFVPSDTEHYCSSPIYTLPLSSVAPCFTPWGQSQAG